ncbi:MAG TPA: pseudaminic acid cytidylyltransferase [Pontibacter sp.]
MKRLAIIPARGGSKRIPRKNIKPFLGKPIIAYSIETALQSGLFDEVMVSTDDAEIAEVAEAYGANVPFLRSETAADDYATTADVIAEVLHNYSPEGKHFEQVCCIYPTAPFIQPAILREALQLLESANYSTVFPVLRYSFPIWRSLKMEANKVEMNWPEHQTSRSQDLEPAFHDAGQFYWLRTADFREQQQLFTPNSGAIELSELHAQDIDNETDWKLAELKYKLLHNLD